MANLFKRSSGGNRAATERTHLLQAEQSLFRSLRGGSNESSPAALAAAAGCLDLVKYVVEVTGIGLEVANWNYDAYQLVRGLT